MTIKNKFSFDDAQNELLRDISDIVLEIRNYF